MKKYLQSVFDYVVIMLPEFKGKMKEPVDPKVAADLFSIWKEEDNKADDSHFKRPATFPVSDVEAMEKAGLIESSGDKFEITQKGADVIKVMVLGDDKSIFEDDDKIVQYQQALANVATPSVITAGRKMKTSQDLQKKYSNNWWKRFLRK